MRKISFVLVLLAASSNALALSRDEIAKLLSNPVGNLVSVPLQFNYEREFGFEGNGERLRLNIQPVLPFSVGENWNVISRTILPVIKQEDFIPDTRQDGIGDVLQSFFFSPKQPSAGGWIWGIGPAFLLPTASDPWLGGDRVGAGPTAVALRQTADGWTYGGLVNHIISADGSDDSVSFVQPFVARRIGPGRTLSANAEATYDWWSEQWIVPVTLGVSQVLPTSPMISLQAGGIYYAEAPIGMPEWGVRFTLTLLYPK